MGGYHQDELFLSLATEDALAAASQHLIGSQAEISVWMLRPKVLRFSPCYFKPSADALAVADSVPMEPYRDFVAAHERLGFSLDEGSLDPHLAMKIHSLYWLHLTTHQAWVYWFHCGDHGLDHEFAVGVGEGGLLHYNETDFWPDKPAKTEPASSLTAALWFLGVDIPNHSEAHWMHGGFRYPPCRPATHETLSDQIEPIYPPPPPTGTPEEQWDRFIARLRKARRP